MLTLPNFKLFNIFSFFKKTTQKDKENTFTNSVAESFRLRTFSNIKYIYSELFGIHVDSLNWRCVLTDRHSVNNKFYEFFFDIISLPYEQIKFSFDKYNLSSPLNMDNKKILFLQLFNSINIKFNTSFDIESIELIYKEKYLNISCVFNLNSDLKVESLKYNYITVQPNKSIRSSYKSITKNVKLNSLSIKNTLFLLRSLIFHEEITRELFPEFANKSISKLVDSDFPDYYEDGFKDKMLLLDMAD